MAVIEPYTKLQIQDLIVITNQSFVKRIRCVEKEQKLRQDNCPYWQVENDTSTTRMRSQLIQWLRMTRIEARA